MTTYQIDLPPLPAHIAKEWKVKRVGLPSMGESFLSSCGNDVVICMNPAAFLLYEFRIILERLAPPLVPPEWLVRSDYDGIQWDSACNRWKLFVGDWAEAKADFHHDLRDMLAKIDPKQTPVAWERGK